MSSFTKLQLVQWSNNTTSYPFQPEVPSYNSRNADMILLYHSASTSTDIHQTVAPPQLFPRPPAAHSPETVPKVSKSKNRGQIHHQKGKNGGGEKDPRQHLPPQHKKRVFPVCPSVATFGGESVVFRVERWSCPYCWQLHSFHLKRSEYFGTTYKLLLMAELLDLLDPRMFFWAFWHCKFFWRCRNFTVPIHRCAGTNTQLNSMTWDAVLPKICEVDLRIYPGSRSCLFSEWFFPKKLLYDTRCLISSTVPGDYLAFMVDLTSKGIHRILACVCWYRPPRINVKWSILILSWRRTWSTNKKCLIVHCYLAKHCRLSWKMLYFLSLAFSTQINIPLLELLLLVVRELFSVCFLWKNSDLQILKPPTRGNSDRNIFQLGFFGHCQVVAMFGFHRGLDFWWIKRSCSNNLPSYYLPARFGVGFFPPILGIVVSPNLPLKFSKQMKSTAQPQSAFLGFSRQSALKAGNLNGK